MKLVTLIVSLALGVLPSTPSRVEYTAGGGTQFTFSFKTFSSAHVKVYQNGVLQVAGYSAVLNSNQDSSPGGVVTFAAPPVVGTRVRIERVLPLTNDSPWVSFSKAKSLELDLDRAAMRDQQLRRDLDDAVAGTISATADASLMTVGANGSTTSRTQAERAAEHLSVKDFGAKCDAQFVNTTVGWTGTDDTVAIQSAINYVSQNDKLRTLHFPEGACLFSKVYVYYDAVLNPGYSATRYGAMTFEGAGFTDDTNSEYKKYGSILASNATTGSAFYLGAPGNIVTRDVTIRGLSFQGRSADAFVVDARGVSYIQIEDSEFIQNTTTGSGLNLENPLFGVLNRVRILNRQTSPSTAGNAALVVSFSSPWTFSGLFQIEQNSMFSGFAYGVHYTGGGLQTFNIKSSEVQGSKYGVYVSNGSIDNMGLDDFYAEGILDSWVQDVGSRVNFPGGGWTYVGTIHNLNVNKWFGNGAFAARSHISLAMPNTVAITTVHVQDLVTPFLEIKSDPDGAKAYSVRGANFVATQSIAHDPFYIFSGETPFVAGLDWPTSDTSISVSAVVSRLDPWTGVGTLSTTNNFVMRHPSSGGDPCYTLATSGGSQRWSMCWDHSSGLLYFRDVNGARTALTLSPTTGTVNVKYSLAWDPATAATATGLGTPADGTMRYCSDCTIANPCAGGGTGAIAKRLNGAWVCN